MSLHSRLELLDKHVLIKLIHYIGDDLQRENDELRATIAKGKCASFACIDKPGKMCKLCEKMHCVWHIKYHEYEGDFICTNCAVTKYK